MSRDVDCFLIINMSELQTSQVSGIGEISWLVTMVQFLCQRATDWIVHSHNDMIIWFMMNVCWSRDQSVILCPSVLTVLLREH
jgi:hypothetical protein